MSQVSNKLGSRTLRLRGRGDRRPTATRRRLALVDRRPSSTTRSELTQHGVAYETIASRLGRHRERQLLRLAPGPRRAGRRQRHVLREAVRRARRRLQASAIASRSASTANVIHSMTDRGLTNNDNTGTSYYVALSSTPSFVDLRQHADGTFPDNPRRRRRTRCRPSRCSRTSEDVWRIIGSSQRQRSRSTRTTSTRSACSRQLRRRSLPAAEQPALAARAAVRADDGLPGTSIEATTQQPQLQPRRRRGVDAITPESGAVQERAVGRRHLRVRRPQPAST